MLRRFFTCFIFAATLLALAPLGRAQPTTEPDAMLKLHASAVTSGEVDLYWYDIMASVPRYLIQRSADHGQHWKGVGTLPGGSATARYDLKDTNVQPATDYEYRLVAADRARTILSDSVSAATPNKNLLEAIRGQAEVTPHDLLQFTFWMATAWALLKLATTFIPQLLVAAIIFFLFFLIHRVARRLAVSSMKRANVEAGIHDMLLTVLRWGILGFAIIIACNQVGIQITALLTGISIIGLAIGFAAQDSLANVIASIIIFWDKPYKVGDWVTIDDQYGKVLKISMRSTRILNGDGDVIVGPNVAALNSRIKNHSVHPLNRTNVPFVLPTKTPVDKATALLLGTVQNDDRLMADPAPSVVIESVTREDLTMVLALYIVDEAHHWAVLRDYLKKGKNALAEFWT